MKLALLAKKIIWVYSSANEYFLANYHLLGMRDIRIMTPRLALRKAEGHVVGWSR